MKLIAAVLLCASFASAQKIVAARAGMVYFAEGTFTIDGKTVRSTARNRLLQLEEGQTAGSPRGHGEILLGPNAMLWTGTQAQVRFDDTRVENTVIALLAGEAMIEVKRSLEDSRIEIDLGTLNLEVTREGIYRFDRQNQTVRVYAGEVLLPGSAKLIRGEESVNGIVRPFDRRFMDELHYWSAYRSYNLEVDAGVRKQWGGDRWGQREHTGFGVKFSDTPGAARFKYLVAPEAGVLYHVDGGAILGPQRAPGPIQLPLQMGPERSLRTQSGRAEIFLGVGITMRVARNSFVKILDVSTARPAVSLDEGTSLIEIADSSEGIPRIRVGDSTTELLKPGLYQFDADAKTLRVYGGEATTTLAGATVHVKEDQNLDLQRPAAPTKFDAKASKEQDPLFKWSADRSWALFLSSADFMTAWGDTQRANRYKHKQFGERVDSRQVRRRSVSPASRLPRPSLGTTPPLF